MALFHRPRTLLALVVLGAALLAGGLLSSGRGAHAQGPPGLPPPVPTLPNVGNLAHSFALRDCPYIPRSSGYGVPGVDPRGVDPRSPDPLTGLTFFVDPTEPAWLNWRSFQRRGMNHDADLMWRIAGQPRARWFGRFTRPNMKRKVREYLRCVQALQPGAVPLMAVMRAQANKCNRDYTGGGRREDRRTRRWYRVFASAVGSARVVILFEPDSLGTLDCQTRSRRWARLKLLGYGVKILSQLPNATIYLEAGASDWEPAKRTAWQLRQIGIRRVRGFMLNVTHYDWTSKNIRHGLRISRLTGGKHFVISTAYNGRGAIHYRRYLGPHKWRTINVWCNPPGRGLGPTPTTVTDHPRVDAYLWIGRPGFSAGSCNGGPLPVGSWWAKRALMFANYATNWIAPHRAGRASR